MLWQHRCTTHALSVCSDLPNFLCIPAGTAQTLSLSLIARMSADGAALDHNMCHNACLSLQRSPATTSSIGVGVIDCRLCSSAMFDTSVTSTVGHAAQGPLGSPIQNQLPGPAVQYHFSNGVLVPSYAVPMPPAPALPSSPASISPSMSHMFNQFSQQARPAARPSPLAAPQGYAANPPARPPPNMPLERSGAGYMVSSRKGHQGYAPSSRNFPLKPGDCC